MVQRQKFGVFDTIHAWMGASRRACCGSNCQHTGEWDQNESKIHGIYCPGN